MKTPKKNTGKKASPAAKKKSDLNDKKSAENPGFFADENDDDFEMPMNDLDLDELDSLDDDDDDDF